MSLPAGVIIIWQWPHCNVITLDTSQPRLGQVGLTIVSHWISLESHWVKYQLSSQSPPQPGHHGWRKTGKTFLQGFFNNISIETPDTIMSRSRKLSQNNNNNNSFNFNKVSSLLWILSTPYSSIISLERLAIWYYFFLLIFTSITVN